MHSKSLVCSGTRLSYLDSGYQSEDKPTLLFIHGNSLGKEVFLPLMEESELSSFRLIAIDLPGHGHSETPANASSFCYLKGYAKLISDFCQELKLSSVVLIGHSLGGHSAFNMLSSEVPHQMLKGIMAFGAPPIENPTELAQLFKPNPAIENFFKGELTILESQMMAKACLQETDYEYKEDDLNLLSMLILKSNPLARLTLANTVASGNLQNEINLMAQTSIPIALIDLTLEQIIDGESFKRPSLQRLPTLWQGKVQSLSSGHTPQLEATKDLAELINNFVTDLEMMKETEVAELT